MNTLSLKFARATDVIDEVYNLAYWMTGNEGTAGMLISQTYTGLNDQTSSTDAYKAFRKIYTNTFGQSTFISLEEAASIDDDEIARAVITLPSDFKMVVLLADVIELSHNDIAAVMEKPLETVRAWIHWGRKLLSKELLASEMN
jgi:hypothetical protein